MTERADAARNRSAILAAAERLIVERGIDAVCVDDVAAAAGVGKGTVFRRFGDKEGLVQAVVECGAAEWHAQAQALLEDSSLSAVDRVTSFAGRLFDHVVGSLPLVVALERTARGCGDNYLMVHSRLTELLGSSFFAHALLASIRGEQIELLLASGMSLAEIRAGVVALAGNLVGTSSMLEA